jgi:hypothetical protein
LWEEAQTRSSTPTETSFAEMETLLLTE